MESLDEQNSFLHARDPSIIAWNRPVLHPDMKMNLYNELASQTMEPTKDPGDLEHLKVYLRLKPSQSNTCYRITSNRTLECKSSSVQASKNAANAYKYSFSRIYGPEVGQKQLFDHCVKEKLLNFINGKNSTLFTYGTSGAGKTFTILGDENNPGIIPRALDYIFRTIPAMKEISNLKPINSGEISFLAEENIREELLFKNKILNSSLNSGRKVHEHTYRNMQQRLSMNPVAEISSPNSHTKFAIWVSFSEIYNENIYDLLQTESKTSNSFGQKPSCSRPKLAVGIDSAGKTYVKNLSSVCVTSGLEAYKVLQFGMHNLNYASTVINNHSSRSHCIFTIKLVQYNESLNEVQISYFNFCDLAGLERVKNSQSVGERLRESSKINNSLRMLGKCIKAIRDSHKSRDNRLIPYRESKLTQLFQPALSGQETITMIVNMNPDKEMTDENVHVLNFSAIAKNVIFKNNAKAVKIALKRSISECTETESSSEYLNQLEERDEQIELLQSKLEEVMIIAQEREDDIRRECVVKMNQQLYEVSKGYQQKLEDMKNRYDKRLQKQQQQMENHYEILIEAAANKRIDCETIDLTEELEDTMELQSQIDCLKAEVQDLKKQLAEEKNKNEKSLEKANQEYNKLEEEFFDVMEKNRDLELQLP